MANNSNNKIVKNPFLFFLPLLFIYIVLILIFSKNEYDGDDIRYLTYAQNLLKGFYSPPYPYIDLGNGPGYPLFLIPFIALKSSFIYIKLANAIFYYFSIVFFFKSLEQIVTIKFSILFTFFWALYPTFYQEMIHVLPEVLTMSLIPILIYFVLKSFKYNTLSKKNICISGLIFGYIVLIKPIFGYVLLVMIFGILILWIINKKSLNYKKATYVLIVSLIINIPYLIYTYHLTGKLFYWSSFGGNNLYWMSTPYPEENGSWIEYPVLPSIAKYRIPGSTELIKLRHQKDFDEILENVEVQKANIKNGVIQNNLTKGIEQDILFKKIALRNITSHPIKFLQNCLSNAGRMLFDFPYSYVLEKPNTLFKLPINGTIIVVSFFCFLISLMNWKKILFSIRFLLFIGLFYFSGSLLGSADSRMFVMTVPILFIWIAFIIQNNIKVKWVEQKDDRFLNS